MDGDGARQAGVGDRLVGRFVGELSPPSLPVHAFCHIFAQTRPKSLTPNPTHPPQTLGRGTATADNVAMLLHRWGRDPSVHGIMIEQPFPDDLLPDRQALWALIPPEKASRICPSSVYSFVLSVFGGWFVSHEVVVVQWPGWVGGWVGAICCLSACADNLPSAYPIPKHTGRGRDDPGERGAAL